MLKNLIDKVVGVTQLTYFASLDGESVDNLKCREYFFKNEALDDVGVGTFKIAAGSQRLAKYFLPAAACSRIPDSLISEYVVANRYCKKGDEISFDVKAAHRGGRTTKGASDALTVELVPSFIPFDEDIFRYQLQDGVISVDQHIVRLEKILT